MRNEDAIEAEYTLRRDRLSGGLWPGRRADDEEHGMLFAFVVYGLVNVAAAALGVLIWIV